MQENIAERLGEKKKKKGFSPFDLLIKNMGSLQAKVSFPENSQLKS